MRFPSSPPNAGYTLRPLTSTDAGAVQQLWSARFGGRPSTQQNWIEAALDPTHSATGLVAASPAADEIIGFTLLEMGGPHYTCQYLSLDPLDLDPPLADRNGIFHLSCVRKAWEGRGLGSAFYERRLRLLTERDVPRAFGIAWHRPHTVDSRVLFEKYEFTCLATVDRYYARFEERLHCPDCGRPCACTASLYTRSIPVDQTPPS